MNSAFDPEAGSSATAEHGAVVDTGTIAWLLPEIVKSFDAATTALRQFRAGAAGVDRADVDLAPLRVARSHLHQAHGALELGELAGVTKLTEAIEEFFAIFEEDPARCDATALDAIIGGCRAIVEYLEDLQSGVRQQPLYLFSSYRDLLAARGADRIHPADLFMVDLGIRPPRDEGRGSALDKDSLNEHRSRFEQALLRYIRNENDEKALRNLSRAVSAIEASVAVTSTPAQTQQRAFWWVTRALFEAMANGGFDAAKPQHAHLKRLAGRVNLQIRKLAEGSNAVAERLFADTLYFVAIAAPVTPHVRDVQARYRLANAVPAGFDVQRYGRIDPAALKTARDVLHSAKAAWSAVVAGEVKQIHEFAKLTTALLDAVGPIKRRGLAQVAQVIDGIATDLGFDPRQPPAAVGLDVATALLFLEGALERARMLDDAFDERAAMVVARVESSALGQEHPATQVDWLDRMSREAEERLTVASFVVELQANLRSAEKELDAFFRDPTQRAGLAEAQKALTQVSGALALLGHDDAHRAIDHARETITRFQQEDGTTDTPAFEALAQSLGAVGFYVEQIKRDHIDPKSFHFDAKTGLFTAAMTRPTNGSDVDAAGADAPSSSAVVQPAAAAADPEADFSYSDIAFAATQVLDSEGTLEDEIAHRAADASERATQLRTDPNNHFLRDELAAAVDDVRRNAALIDDRSLQDEAATVLSLLRRAGREPLASTAVAQLVDSVVALTAQANRSVGIAPPSAAPAEPVVAVPSADNHEAVDAELLEIFLEEATQVLIDAEASLRVLDADPLNATATINLRRNFHTLKGSSRMVGLMAFGEAGWAIEETLNGHIADQVAASNDLRSLIDYAIRYLSAWTEELRATGRSSRIPDALIEAARAVRAGNTPGDMDMAFASTEVMSFADTEVMATPDEAPTTALAESIEGEFEKTQFAPRQAPAVEDSVFAATHILGDQLFSDLEFFDEQPLLPADDEAVADGHALPSLDARSGEAPFEASAVEQAPADEEAVALDWLDIPVEHAEPGATTEQHADAPASVDGPVEEPIDAVEETGTTAAASDADAAVERPDNVVAFTMRNPITPADDVRQIGSLTLSVALFNIYLTEADELLRVLTQDFAEWRHELDRYVSESAMRAVHSLAGSSATVGLVPAHDVAAAIEEVLQALYRDPMVLSAGQVECLQEAVESLRKMLHRFAAERMPDPDPVRIAALIALRRGIGPEAAVAKVVEPVPSASLPFEPLDFGDDAAPAVVEPVAGEIEQPISADETIDFSAFEIEAENDVVAPVDEVAPAEPVHVEDFDAITTIGASGMPFDVQEPVEAGGLDQEPSTFADEVVSTEAVTTEETPVAETLIEETSVEETSFAETSVAETSVEEIAFDEVPAADAPVSEAPLEQVAVEASFDEAAPIAADVDMPADSVDEAPVEPTPGEAFASEAAIVEPALALVDQEALAMARRVMPSEREIAVHDDIDADLLDVFVAEGNEILPQIGTLLRTWQAHRDNAAPSRMLLRHLHTLKGSARMAGAMRLGEVVHDIEARVESAARLHEVPAPLIDELLAAHDRSLELFDYLQHPGSEQAQAAELAAAAGTPAGSAEDQPVVEAPERIAEVSTPVGAALPARGRTREQKQPSQQVVRVNSETLDRLVNLAGEVSISRARIENEVLQIKGAMADLSENVERLRAQLREIELQAEFQMQSQMQSQQAAGEEREKFDPLEFDRFTRFQELTRMMAESVNDVKTVQLNLQKSLEIAEVDLTSQRRMTRDLQQDLMSVRMVPFSSIAERLYRVARRAAKEVDKRVNLDIRGGSVEIDRSVLERMAGPFEHLLRNHIVHGIESRDARREHGKNETGELLVEVRQEGNEIVLAFSDDGAGLNHDRIRSKARELNLIGSEDISDAQAAELIFHPGFSTASEVTELAGRGVGMDVVRTEAMELAGRVAVETEAGKGTRFTITLPLTLAVTQVVLVSVASRVYALPAVLVEQVQQFRPQALADAYRAGQLMWADAPVKLAFLGTLLGIEDSVPVAQRTSPVLILRSAGERVAVHVDEVIGNQEVVVKNLGPQLARMTGIAGATVLGSGEIVLILNPVQLTQMARAEAAREAVIPVVDDQSAPAEPASQVNAELHTLPTVMVVDDSLTVRRVTQRLLSREGYQVVLAKDGVDALEQLQDYAPDVMLVDIEMPRMDGFDLTRNVRNDARFRNIPIIMITSRTAEKHRRHAAELGVDAYLGKPYQEDELLDLLALHLKTRRGQPA